MHISVVIPTLDEDALLEETLVGIPPDAHHDVVVVGTRAATQIPSGASVLVAPRGRARQMNHGARHSRGEVLLFLHADTRLPPDAFRAIRRALDDPRCVGGAFRVALDARGPAFTALATIINVRSRFLRRPFGDQALFVRRSVFDSLGGFRDIEIMEDVDLVRRLRRRGRLAFLSATVVTSARRWQANGLLWTTLVNQGAQMMWRLGVDPARIRRWYDARLDRGEGPDPPLNGTSAPCRPDGPGP
jgi:rSAM/selenodomain-associated transferase 2